jgi:hypothetical protein
MTADEFRRLALALDDAVEGSHMNHPDFRVGGRIFASLQPGLEKGMAALSPDEQARFMAGAPRIFEPSAGAWGRSGCTSVVLAAVGRGDVEIVGEALTVAWQLRRSKNATTGRKPAAPKPKAVAQKRKTAVAKKRKAAAPKRKSTRTRRAVP